MRGGGSGLKSLRTSGVEVPHICLVYQANYDIFDFNQTAFGS